MYTCSVDKHDVPGILIQEYHQLDTIELPIVNSYILDLDSCLPVRLDTTITVD